MTRSHFLAVAAVLMVATAADAQTMSYGPSITLDNAKKVAAPAIAEARKNNWTMVVAIVDTAGDLVYFEKMDDTQVGSTERRHQQGAIGGALQAPDEGLSGCPGRRRGRPAHPRAPGRGPRRRRRAAADGRQDRRCHRRVGRHQRAGRSGGGGRRRRAEVEAACLHCAIASGSGAAPNRARSAAADGRGARGSR